MRIAVIASLFSAYLATLSPLALAADMPVDLELALAVDVSRSVDDEEAALQRSGYIKAFRHPSILDAITHGPLGRIAVTYFEWAGYARIRPVVPWMVIKDRASAEAFVRVLETDEPEQGRRTSISGAIDFAAASFENNGFTARRRVIDISGDGANNSGGIVTGARDRAIKDGITINGLPIVNGRPTMSGWAQVENLDLFYRDCVIGGPGAFYVMAKDFADFPRAVLRKLMLEIAGLTPVHMDKPRLLWRAQMKPARQSPPCDIGEKRRRDRWMNGDDFYDSDPDPLPGSTPPPRR